MFFSLLVVRYATPTRNQSNVVQYSIQFQFSVAVFEMSFAHLFSFDAAD